MSVEPFVVVAPSGWKLIRSVGTVDELSKVSMTEYRSLAPPLAHSVCRPHPPRPRVAAGAPCLPLSCPAVALGVP